MLIPVDLETVASSQDNPRIGDLVRDARKPMVVIVGFPSDRGVEINGGRAGAADGPDAIRRALYKMTPGSPLMADFWSQTADIGNVEITGDVETDQNCLAEVLRSHREANNMCIILGGGHETAYGHFLGYVQAQTAVGIINLDAHADVRDLVDGSGHSGSSFRQALENTDMPAASYTVFGLAPNVVSNSHVKFLDGYPGERVWVHDADPVRFDELLDEAESPLMVSFDLDAVDQCYAPGVSAPAVGGLRQNTWFRAAYSAGVSGKVRSIDVCELNPRYDIDNRTARLAALTIWHFVEGFSTRSDLSKFVHITE